MNYYNNNPALKFQLSHPLMQKIVALKEQNFSEKDTYDYAPRDLRMPSTIMSGVGNHRRNLS